MLLGRLSASLDCLSPSLYIGRVRPRVCYRPDLSVRTVQTTAAISVDNKVVMGVTLAGLIAEPGAQGDIALKLLG